MSRNTSRFAILFKKLCMIAIVFSLAFGSCLGTVSYAENCLHTRFTDRIGDTWFGEYTSTSHEHHYIREWVCDDCGAMFKSEEFVVWDLHFGVDVCACGYKTTSSCSHPYFEQYAYVAPGEGDITIVPETENEHSITETCDIYCGVCNQLIRIGFYQNRWEKHSFDNKGYCAKCGYQGEAPVCDHTKSTALISETATADTTTTHVAVREYRTGCACGKYNEKKNETVTEDCSFDHDEFYWYIHEDGKGHQLGDECICGNRQFSGKYIFYLDGCETCAYLYGREPIMQNDTYSEDVKQLQKDLTTLGYFSSPCDGLFGPLTHAAVLSFQSDFGILQTGIVCIDTQNAIAAALRGELKPGDPLPPREAPETPGIVPEEGRYVLRAAFGNYDAQEDRIYIEEGESAGIYIYDTVGHKALALSTLANSVYNVYPGTDYVTLGAEQSIVTGPGGMLVTPVYANYAQDGMIALYCGGIKQDEMYISVLDFRRFAYETALLYNQYENQSPYVNYNLYYYEASDIKYEFDRKLTNRDLSFNTYTAKKENYDQDTKDAILQMLTWDIQAKELEMQEMTPEERAAYYPGIVFNPVEGAWTENTQAVITEQLKGEEIDTLLDKEAGTMYAIGIRTAWDTLNMGSNTDDDLYIDLITKVVDSVWAKWCEIEHQRTCAILKNYYRNAMIEDIMAAQKNIDEQMYSGLANIRDQLTMQEGSLSHDDQLMLEVITIVLDSMEHGREMEDYLQKTITINGDTLTVDEALEIIANDLVNEIGITGEVPISWQEAKRDIFLTIVFESVREGLGAGYDSLNPSAMENIAVKLALDNCIDSLYSLCANETIHLDKDGSGTVSKAEVTQWIIGCITSNTVMEESIRALTQDHVFGLDMSKVDIDKQIQIAQDNLDFATITADMMEMDDTLTPAGKEYYREQLEKATENLEKWEQLKLDNAFFSELISNGWDFIISSSHVLSTFEPMHDMVRSENLYSCIASQMYRTKQLADDARSSLEDRAELYCDWENVRNASLEDLRTFVEDVYVVFNTDLVGHSYYSSLAAAYYYETDYIARLVDHGQEAQDWIDRTYDNADSFLENTACVVMYVPLCGIAMHCTVWLTLAVSDYLDMVHDDSAIGSWLDDDMSALVYDSIGEYVEKATIPPKYYKLFN